MRANYRFYQSAYEQDATTELVPSDEVSRLLTSNFGGTPLDISEKVGLVRDQVRGGRLLDYGCSWGYGIYQFQQAGFDAVGFEISRRRAEFGRTMLGVEIIDDELALESIDDRSFDVIYCSHVLEHLPDLRRPFTVFQRLLKPSGILIIFVPNAGGRHAKKLGVKWGPMIGEKHCTALDAIFFSQNMPDYGFRPKFGSSPYELPLVAFEQITRAEDSLCGEELLVVAKLLDWESE